MLLQLGLYPYWKSKQRVFSHCFRGMAVDTFNSLCSRFACDKARLMRPKGMKKLRKVLAEGGKVVVVSASVNNWVEPFFAGIGGVYVVGTMVEEREGVLTGRFLTKNCYGEE